MKAIFAFSTVKTYYKPINDNFIRLAKLSVKSAKKYYKTKIYCDEESLDFFTKNGILFDEVVIIKDFIYEYQNHYSISKIYAMMNEKDPYIILDFDTVLLEKIDTTHTITYGHKEYDLTKFYVNLNGMLWVRDYYLTPFNNHVKEHYDKNDIDKFNWNIYPSFCLVMVNKPTFLELIYRDIFSKVPKIDIESIPPPLLEQFLPHQYLIKHNVDFGFLTENNYFCDSEFNNLELISKKYVHLSILNKNINEELNFLETII